MRASAYAGVSTALAGGVVAYAFAQRPNFYSACVFLSQSNLSVMILINLCFLIAYCIVWTFSRLLYGRLRPIEVEQLYERGWFAVTETCLAMTIFRDEIGAWFIAMFVALMAGRVWGWIGHGRVEMLEQQPPADPRSFHTRLTLSLIVSLAYDFTFVSYAASTVYEQARPNMMVMFLFEYVLLTISTISTALRYLILVVEIKIQQKQTEQMMESKRAEVRERREDMLRERQEREERGEVATGGENPLPSEDDVDEMDIEAPGWEAKGQMVLVLDLLTDFMRLLVYLTFFAVLTTFFGLPIHIMRDLFVTSRSFIKRLTAMLRYRNATRDMNARYPDATQEEIADNPCIICREDMRAWSQLNNPDGRTVDGRPVRQVVPVAEKNRSKKLPCGHILHLGCLKGWLERQQVCPTCRAPVGGPMTGNEAAAAQPANGAAVPGAAGVRPAPGQPLGRGQQAPAVPNNGIRGGMIHFGPLRVAYGRAVMPGNVDPAAAQEAARQAMMAQARVPPGARVFGLEIGNVPATANGTPLQGWRQPHPSVPRPNSTNSNTNTSNTFNASSNSIADIGELIRTTEQRIMEEAEKLELQRQDLAILQRMQLELSRLQTVDRVQRTISQHEQEVASANGAVPNTTPSVAASAPPAREALPPPPKAVGSDESGADAPPYSEDAAEKAGPSTSLRADADADAAELPPQHDLGRDGAPGMPSSPPTTNEGTITNNYKGPATSADRVDGLRRTTGSDGADGDAVYDDMSRME